MNSIDSFLINTAIQTYEKHYRTRIAGFLVVDCDKRIWKIYENPDLVEIITSLKNITKVYNDRKHILHVIANNYDLVFKPITEYRLRQWKEHGLNQPKTQTDLKYIEYKLPSGLKI